MPAAQPLDRANMLVVCSKCGRVLTGNDLNVTTDVAHCPGCDEVFPLSSLLTVVPTGPVDLDNPPRGAWYRNDFDGFVVGATTRNPIAFILVPFMCAWSGGSLGGIYGSQIAQGKFNLMMSLFGIPFLLGTLLIGTVALMSVCGKVVVRVRDSEGEVFTGIGPFGFRRRFSTLEVTAVLVERSYVSRNNSPTMTIVIDGPSKVRFGSGLSEARRDFIANALRRELMHGK